MNSSSTSAKPNVIVFFTDQQRWDTVGLHGNPLDLTPNFDRLARRGTHLANSFTCQPVCGPARSALMTGKYPTTTGCYRNGIPLPAAEKTLAHHFRDAGYRTGYIGKWHLGSQDPVPEEERGGYQDWLAANLLEFTSDSYNATLYDEANTEVKLPGYRVDALADAAIRYAADHQAEPFFLFLSFLEPHHQNHLDNYPAPHVLQNRYVDAWTPPDLAALGGTAAQHLPGYYGMVKRLDDALGRIMDALYSLGLSDDTIVLFTSDHACHFKTRNAEYKRSCHDSSIRVPTAIWGPGFDVGRELPQITSLIDLPATLLDGAGIPIPEEFAGRSLVPLIQNKTTDWDEEAFVQISESQVGRALRTQRFMYCVSAPEASGWDRAASDVYEEESLYDLHADPYQLMNLIGHATYEEVKVDLRERLLAQIEKVEGQRPTIRPAASHSSAQRPELHI